MTSIHVQPLFELETWAAKQRKAAEIAADVVRFEAAGGQIQRLGTSPIDRHTISRRQVVEGGHAGRAAKKGGRA